MSQAKWKNNALNTITHLMKSESSKIYSLLWKAETKKAYIRIIDGALNRSSSMTDLEGVDTWMNKLTPKKKKLEKVKQRFQELAKVERLESLLEEEIRARKTLEKRLSDFMAQLDQQKHLNNFNQQKIETLETTLEAMKLENQQLANGLSNQ